MNMSKGRMKKKSSTVDQKAEFLIVRNKMDTVRMAETIRPNGKK